MTPERQAEIEALGDLKNPVMNEDAALLQFVCEAKRGIRELSAELQQQRQRAEAAEAELAAIVYQLMEQAKDAQPDPNWEQTLDNL